MFLLEFILSKMRKIQDSTNSISLAPIQLKILSPIGSELNRKDENHQFSVSQNHIITFFAILIQMKRKMQMAFLRRCLLIYQNRQQLQRTQLPFALSFTLTNPHQMSSDKRILSFALNPLTNKIEFVAVPQTALERIHQPGRFRNPSTRQRTTRQSQMRVNHSGESTEEQSGRKQRRNEQKVHLNDLLTSLVLDSSQAEPASLQPQLNGVTAMASITAIELLLMMDYTQKLSYIRSKCRQPSLCDKITQEISRVTKLVFEQQETYFQMLCSQYLPEQCQ